MRGYGGCGGITVLLDLRMVNVFFFPFSQKQNGIVFSSGVNNLHSVGNIQSEQSS